MADDASAQPEQRSAVDKERSRQLSRPVNVREAARHHTAKSEGKPARGKVKGGSSRDAKRQRSVGPQASGQGASGREAPRRAGRDSGRPTGARQRPAYPPARRPGPARRTGWSRTSLFTWGTVALVVVVVVVLVVVYTASSKTTKSTQYGAKPVSATVLHDVTHVPASVFDKVGRGIVADIHQPSVRTGQPPLHYTGKPGMFALLGEFCPYCAAERWAIITAFSRFGTFSGLKTMQSSTTDIDPATQTFTFATATYTSSYFSAKLKEIYGQDKPTGAQTPLEKLPKQEARLAAKYDHAPTAPSGSGNSIPFMDYGNKVIFYEVSYTPGVLQGLSRKTIAAGLDNPKLPVTKLIIGSANNISASVCAIDGGRPGSVCSSPGVRAAAKGLGLHV